MLNYRVEIQGERHPLPVLVIEEQGYDLVSEFLLAEGRSFGSEILGALDRACMHDALDSSFSGNVFSLEIGKKRTRITDDISERECEIPTADLQSMTADYLSACRTAAHDS